MFKSPSPRAGGSLATYLMVVLSVAASVGGCAEQPGEPAPEPAGQRAVQPVVEPVDGMKYYVGGPIMKPDKYGRLRLAGFNGEIGSPTSRGLLIGIKVDEDNSFEYRTWLNGLAVSQSTGFLDEDGLLWYTQRVTYDGDGKVIAKQKFEYDNQKEVMISRLEHVDPETGETVKSHSEEMPYAPTMGSVDREDQGDESAEEKIETDEESRS